MKKLLQLLALLLLLAQSARAQVTMVHTEGAESLGSGTVLFGLGAEYFSKHNAPGPDFPVAEVRVGEALLHWGVSENVDFNVDWRGRLLARYADGRRGSDWGDATISTKITVLRQSTSPLSVAIRSSVKLPNTDYMPFRLGSNQTDYALEGLVSRTFGDAELRLNLGIQIVGNPLTLESQDDIYACGAAVVLPFSERVRSFLELEGFSGYFGQDDKKLMARLGTSFDLVGISWNLFGGIRVAGNNHDIGTAFESSENWSAGIFLVRQLWPR